VEPVVIWKVIADVIVSIAAVTVVLFDLDFHSMQRKSEESEPSLLAEPCCLLPTTAFRTLHEAGTHVFASGYRSKEERNEVD
jgi:hypothetical protein